MTVRKGQVWLYRRTDREEAAPVVHVITSREDRVCRSVSVFTDDGEANAEVILSGVLEEMGEGGDEVGTWTLLYDPSGAGLECGKCRQSESARSFLFEHDGVTFMMHRCPSCLPDLDSAEYEEVDRIG